MDRLSLCHKKAQKAEIRSADFFELALAASFLLTGLTRLYQALESAVNSERQREEVYAT